jgi:N-acyl-D-aspartate/D-glutamate deacylase
LIVSPGFINTHTHSGLRVFKHSEDDSKRMQGITPALIGQAKSSAGNNPLIAVINGEVSLNSS